MCLVAGCKTLTSALDAHNPNILHFSGHGDEPGLCFENEYGKAIDVSKEALANLLRTQKHLKLVVLSACYSRDQAQAIADAVGYVIGMEERLSNANAIAFSREFYRALGYGRTFEDSFNRAKSALALTSNMKVHFLKSEDEEEFLDDPEWEGISDSS